MELHTGDPCPCCGKPIKAADPEVLRLLAFVADMLHLPARSAEDSEAGEVERE